MSIGTICNREVIIAEGTTSIKELANLMRKNHVGNLVIIGERNGIPIPIGIVTDRDIVIELIAKNIDLDSVSARDIMSTKIVIVRENDEVIDTIKQMRLKGVRRMSSYSRTSSSRSICQVTTKSRPSASTLKKFRRTPLGIIIAPVSKTIDAMNATLFKCQ